MLTHAFTDSLIGLVLFFTLLAACGVKQISLSKSLLTAGMWTGAFLMALRL